MAFNVRACPARASSAAEATGVAPWRGPALGRGPPLLLELVVPIVSARLLYLQLSYHRKVVDERLIEKASVSMRLGM